MPKHGFLTPKAIANRIKAKGLQKLRWYCQVCQKQCRDENGFKCHMTSESHQRQLLLVAENPGKYIHAYSDEFLHGFMQLLRLQYGTRRVHCNEVYQEYIKDKNHFHMNATRWETLTGFVMYLGKSGQCEVDNTPKGWFMRYIDRSPAALARIEAASKKVKMDKDDEERSQQIIEQQIARATAAKKTEDEVPVYTELMREHEEEKVSFSLSRGALAADGEGEEADSRDSSDDGSACSDSESLAPSVAGSVCSQESGFSRVKSLPLQLPALPNALKGAASGPMKRKSSHQLEERESRKRKLTALEELRMMEEQRKEKMNRRDNWLTEGIVVKVVHKKLGERYHRLKGVVEEVRDLYTGIIKMLDTGDKLKIDQAYLETVIPNIGKPVLVVNGAYRGLRAVMESLDADNFCLSVRIDQGPARGRLLDKVPYEDVSKLAADS